MQRISSYIRKILVAAFCVGLSLFSQAQSLHEIRVDLVYLASDYLGGREAGTIGEALAAEHIAARFEQIGLAPYGEEGKYFQPFAFTYSTDPHGANGEERTGNNVVGWIDNGAAATVIIGAHYDHVGMGDFGSRSNGDPAVHNGADDNASGVAGLLYLAAKLKASQLRGHNYVFVAFTAEELGLFGSKHYVKAPTCDLESVSYMLNLDMVGRLDEEQNLVINGAGTSPQWQSTFANLAHLPMRLTTTESGIGASDHTSFYLQDIPALHFFTGTHTDYHTPADDSDKINFEGIKQVADWMYALIAQVDDVEQLEFSKTKDESRRQASSFKVTLGVMPDYSEGDGNGMRIDAVLDNRPAQRAGIQDGDVVVQIGDIEVNDIYDYMEGLSKFEPGEKTQVKVRRGEEMLTLEVEF
ncbi:MAG: M20/M25/M40 family metallo-hydrolase [Bacteroidota bacterium]